MKKLCIGCGQERDAEQDFNFRDKNRGIRQTKCKYCQSQISKQHYMQNKQSYFERARSRDALIIQDNQRKLAEYLRSHPCVDCGQIDVRVLEFDHVHGNKSYNIARMISEGFSWSTIEVEIAKCEVRCANCHRIKTGEKNGSWRNLFNSSRGK